MTPSRRTGRRPGPTTSRDALLQAARQLFAEQGFDATTVRAIAAAAGVDAAMIRHHFGSKEKLFAASIDFPFDPGEVIEQVLTGGPREEIGERLATTFVTLWDSAGGEAAQSLVRTAVTSEWATDLLQRFLIQRVLRKGFTKLMGWTPEAQWRASLVASQLIGLLVTRYIVRFEPLASASLPVVVSAIAPNLQHYITGDLGAELP